MSSPVNASLPGSRTERISDHGRLAVPGNDLLRAWTDRSFVLAEDWEQLPTGVRKDLERDTNPSSLLPKLVEHRLLTDYQANRIKAGKTFGLVLGNFRVLRRLGAGGMGVVFQAEHITMRRLVAIKVLSFLAEEDPQLLARFRAEMRAVAQLQHPNIIGAFDAGTAASADPDQPSVHYFVMEYVQGRDLDEWVHAEGPLSVAHTCHLAYQVATALAEAHKHHLVHRDIKPANILMTPEGQAKLLDFGLARHYYRRITEPGTVLGTIDYMAPEQAGDASTVDIRADIYGLGGTMFWCLTGTAPFQPRDSLNAELIARLTQPPPSLRKVRPELPPELDHVVAKMMALDPNERYQTPQAVMRAVLPFLGSDSQVVAPNRVPATPAVPVAAPQGEHHVLVVDDEPDLRRLASLILQAEGVHCHEAANGVEALELLRGQKHDLVLLDVDMPGLGGIEVLARLRAAPPAPFLKVIMMTGRVSADDLAQTLLAGADDYLAKPFSPVQLRGRVRAALRLKDVQEHTHNLNRRLMALAAEQERALEARDSDLVHARNALVLALAKLVEHRDQQHGAHLVRLQRHCRRLAEEAARLPEFADQINPNFVQMLEACAPLHDIGKVALPEHILLKSGKLTTEERLIMQTHTTIGAETLAAAAQQHGLAQAFWQTAIAVVRHHHERWDGTGYPDRLAGDAIPLPARIVAVADAYDALRSRRTYRPGLRHMAAVQLIEESVGQFDPRLVSVFSACAASLEQTYRELPD